MKCTVSQHKPSSISRQIITCATARPIIKQIPRKVFICQKPLVGWEDIAWIFPKQLSLHRMIVIRSEIDTWMCDFLPLEPTNPQVIFTLLTLGEVPGEVRVVKVKSELWRDYEEYIGEINDPEFLQDIQSFNEEWNKSLSLVRNDCQSYVLALSKYLTKD